MKSVCVFCGSNPGTRPAYLLAARQIGTVLGRARLRVVYGGTSVGLMGAVADAALAAGGQVAGVLPEFMSAREIAHPGLTELCWVASMHERKAQMAARADAFVALPGGFGTMDELFEVLTWSQLGLHHKPVALLDVDGYYTSLVAFLDHAVAEGLLRPEHRAMLFADDDPERLVARLADYQVPTVARVLDPSRT